MRLSWWPRRWRRRLTLVREVHYAMGTVLDVRLYHQHTEVGLRLLRHACQEVRRLEALLSRHMPESELSRLNRRAGRGPMLISPELFDLLRATQHWAQWTRGAFDPTTGALSSLWRMASSCGQVPAHDRLQAARRAAGWEKLQLVPPRMAELTTAGMELDLGGIGKGFAVDRMGHFLRQHGVHHAFINFGESSLLAIGGMPDGRSWPVVVRTLDGGVSTCVIGLQDCAVSTSSSFGQAFFLDGHCLSHVLDPRHGHPLGHPLAVTVLAPTATAAEALSTALLVGIDTGEAIPPLPPGVLVYHMRSGGELIPLKRTSGDATLCHAGL
jgi:FAD:protein FMN transferase